MLSYEINGLKDTNSGTLALNVMKGCRDTRPSEPPASVIQLLRTHTILRLIPDLGSEIKPFLSEEVSCYLFFSADVMFAMLSS